jgi:hypothetical protein
MKIPRQNLKYQGFMKIEAASGPRREHDWLKQAVGRQVPVEFDSQKLRQASLELELAYHWQYV